MENIEVLSSSFYDNKIYTPYLSMVKLTIANTKTNVSSSSWPYEKTDHFILQMTFKSEKFLSFNYKIFVFED